MLSMLSILVIGAISPMGISCNPKVNIGYLPPDTSFMGYPPSKPHPPPTISIENEDPESIVIDAPPFSRNLNSLSSNGDSSSRAQANPPIGEPANREPLLASVHRNSNSDTSFTHFHSGSTSSTSPSLSYSFSDDALNNNRIYRPDQYYARTVLHTPNVHNTLTSFNYSRPYQGRSGSTPHRLFSNNDRGILQYNLPNTKAYDASSPYNPAAASSQSHLGSSIIMYPTTSPSYYPSYFKDQYHNQNNELQLNNQQQQHSLFPHSTSENNFIVNRNNHYLHSSENDNQGAGYTYDQPTIPFNYVNNVNRNAYDFNGKEKTSRQMSHETFCQNNFK